MKLSRLEFVGPVILLAFAALNCGCSAEMRKKRFSEQAERYFKQEQYDEAKIEYLKLLRLDPTNATAYARMGQMWLEEDAPMRAGGFLGAALRYNPNDVASRVRLARAYSLIGQMAQARQEAEKALDQAPENGEALLLLAQSARSDQDRAAASQRIQRYPQPQNGYPHLAAAAVALQKNDRAAAEAESHAALTAAPMLPAAYTTRALVLLAQNTPQIAGQELKSAADLSPLRSRERLSYAEFKASTGARDEAKAFLSDLTTKARDFIGAWILQAKIALADKKYDETTALLENVFTRDPDNLDGRILRAQVYLAKGDRKKGIEIFEQLDKSFPDSPMFKYQLASAYLQEGSTAQAISQLQEAVRINPTYSEAVLLLAELNIRRGNAEGAINPLSTLLKGRPDLMQAQLLLAGALEGAGRGDDAVAIIQQQIKAAPQDAQSYYRLGLLLRDQKKTAEARQAFEKVIQLDKNNIQAIAELVNLEIANKAYGTARQRVDALLKQDPQSATGYYMSGTIDLAEGKRQSGEVSLKKAIELNPNFSAAYELLIQSYLSAGELRQALQQVNLILNRNPKAVTALTLAGLIDEKLNDFASARDHYERALALNPKSSVVLNNLANIYAEDLNDLTRAVELGRKARDIAPSDPIIADTLGWLFYRQGDYQQATQLLQQAAANGPTNPEVQFHLGMAQYMMGNRGVARTAFEKAIAAEGEFPWKSEAQARLTALTKEGTDSNISPADLEKIANEKSNDPIALVALGDSYQKQGAIDKAADAYNRALRANSRFLDATLKLALLNAGPLKDVGKAAEYARKARELAPNDPHVTGTVGRIAYEIGNSSWAHSLLQDAARELPDDRTIAHDFAWAAYSTGKVKEAQQAMQRVANAPSASDTAADAKLFLAMTALDSDDPIPGSAETEVNKALGADPTYTPALMAKAAIESQKGDNAGAAVIYNGILQKWPDFAPAQKYLAAIYENEPANAEKAYDLANKARRTLADDPDLRRTLGALSYQRKEYARAVQLLQESDAKKPLEGRLLFMLGMAHLQLGHKTEAKKNLDRALTAGIPDDLAKQAKDAMVELDKAGNQRR